MHPRSWTHRPMRWWTAVVVTVGLAVTGCAPGTQEESGGGGPREAEVGEPRSLDDLPALPAEGVAVQLDDGLVFVDLGGTVHGHVPGATLETVRGLQHVPSGLVPVSADEHGTGWLEPSTGVFSPGHWGTPLIDDATALLDPEAGSPDAYVLHRPDEALAQWNRDERWWLSAGHRTVTWAACPDQTEDLGACPMNGYDLDMGGNLGLDPGCWVADTLGDMTRLQVCTDQDAEPRSWLELSEPGEEPRRYELPRPVDQPEDMPTTGHFVSGQMHEGWILAQASMECEVSKSVLIDADTAELHPVPGEADPLTSASLVLGWSEDGRAAVLVHDGPCAEEAEPGVWLLDPANGDTDLVYPLPSDTSPKAHLWQPLPGIDLSARHSADRPDEE